MFLRMFFHIFIDSLMWSVWRQALVLFCGLINITLLVVTTVNEIKSIKPYWEPGPEAGWNYTLLGIDIIIKYTDPKLNRLPTIGNPASVSFLVSLQQLLIENNHSWCFWPVGTFANKLKEVCCASINKFMHAYLQQEKFFSPAIYKSPDHYRRDSYRKVCIVT